MTKIVFLRRGGVYYGFEERGHAGFGEEGDDILCSALSAMTMLIINTVELSYASNIDYTISDTEALITVKCLEALPEYGKDEKKRYAIGGLFMGYYYQLNDLLEEYSDYLDVDVRDEDSET